ncbi:MAG: class I adenylate-forming enzyme family protein [Parvularculaceae bacterium]
MSRTQIDYLNGLFRNGANRVFLISEATGRALTRGEVAARARAIAGELGRAGVEPGDRVGFVAGNSIDLALLYFGAWAAGAQVIPVNPQLTPAQIAEILDLADVRLALVSVSERAAAAAAADEVLLFKEETGERAPGALDVFSLPTGDERPLFGAHGDDETAFLRIYTSGTTSRPKGIDLAFRGLIGNERAFCDFLGIGEANRFYNILPMSYLGGVHNLLLLPLAAGGSTVIGQPLGGTGLYSFWDTVRERGVNTLWFTSAMLSMLMALRDDEDMGWLRDHIRLGLVGMAPLQPSVKDAFEARFGFRLHENYAMSETTFLTSSHPGIAFRPGSSGKILPDVELEIVGESGALVPDGEVGEIRVRTPYMMKGYVDAPQSDLDSWTDDGFRTGDLAYLVGGELFVCGRSKDLIIRGGLNIAPAQIEARLLEHESIADVAVVGVPDGVYGEEVAAMIVPRSQADIDPAALKEWMKDRIPLFQRPKKIRIADELPMVMSGNVD